MITVEQIMSWEPCDKYDEAMIRELIGDGKTLFEVLDLPIPADDRLWVVLRKDVLPDKILHEFACRCAESVLPIWDKMYPEDKRPHAAIRMKRFWMEGKATDLDLAAARAAAGDAAWDAAWAAAGDAAGDAAWDAAGDAAWDAARAAAWDAARAAAGAAAWDAAWDAARDAARDGQIIILRDIASAQIQG